MYFVYACTYVTNNLADHVNIHPDISPPIQKLGLVFLANTTCSLIKDKKYAVKYGQAVSRPFPLASYVLFFIRDIIAMASAFTIPPIAGKIIADKTGISVSLGEKIAQISSPLVLQLILTPIHLTALDIYNRPGENFASRVAYMKGIFKNALILRMMRFLPAYGFGGIINTELRTRFKANQNQ